MRRTSYASVLVSIAVIAATSAGCGVGPSSRPDVAVGQPGGGGLVAPSTTAPSTPSAPILRAPAKNLDLSWADCTHQTLTSFALGPGPTGLIIECAQFTAPVDAAGAVYGTVSLGAMRARLAQTPPDAAPLILTSGADRPSTTTLADLAVNPSTALLAAHPIVAVDRRGVGTSTPTTCMSPEARQGLADNGQFTPVTGDQLDGMQTLSEQATTACKDFLQPEELTFDAPHAADDIEAVRQQWQVKQIGIIGIGNGTLVATSYAQKYPDHVGRLVLDSPWALGANQATVTEQHVQGQEAALTGYAQRCVSTHCSLGSDPRAAIVDLLHKAGANQLSGISVNAIITAITGFISDPRVDQAAHGSDLADALSAAGRGDVAGLRQWIGHETAETATDGQFVAACSDLYQRTPLLQARDLRTTWRAKYPVFGEQAAIGLAACTAWPTTSPMPAPTALRGLPVLVLSAAADPITGNGGVPSVTGAFDAAGARTAVISWQGFGHPVLTHSNCAQEQVIGYLNDGTLPSDGMACPA